jgi:hypothetical protein
MFFSALKRYMTCYAIYWQKARTKTKDIGGSDRLTDGCVWQRDKGGLRAIFLIGYKQAIFSLPIILSGFGGLVASMLASGTQDRGFAPDRSRRIFPAGKIHSMPAVGGEVK